MELTVQRIIEIISKKGGSYKDDTISFYSHAVSRRAKDIAGRHLPLDEADRDKRPIMEAIKEMDLGLIDIVMLRISKMRPRKRMICWTVYTGTFNF